MPPPIPLAKDISYSNMNGRDVGIDSTPNCYYEFSASGALRCSDSQLQPALKDLSLTSIHIPPLGFESPNTTTPAAGDQEKCSENSDSVNQQNSDCEHHPNNAVACLQCDLWKGER